MSLDLTSPNSPEIHVTANEKLSYGSGFCGVETSKEKLASLLSRGLIPEIWLGRSSNGSFDAVCFTVVPAGPQASDRFDAMKLENRFVDDLNNPERPSYQQPETIMFGVIADLMDVSMLERVKLIKANGRFPPEKYPTEVIPGIDTRSLEKSRRGMGGGWGGEVRVYFDETENERGITPQEWKGIVVKENDLQMLLQWMKEVRTSQGLKIKPLPIFSPEMKYLGST